MAVLKNTHHSVKMSISKKKILLTFFIFLAFFVSLTSLLGVSRDYLNYDNFFSETRNYGFEYLITHRFEPIFCFFSYFFVFMIDNNLLIYAFFVIVSLWLKGIVLVKNNVSLCIMFLIIIFYTARFFPLLEMTQIRAALSASFLLLAMQYSMNAKKNMSLLMFTFAVGFHMSSIILLPFLLYIKTPKRFSILIISIMILFFGFFLKDLLIELLSEHIKIISIYARQGVAGFGGRANPINSAVILDVLTIITGLCLWKKSTIQMKHMLFLQIMGLMIFWSFYNYAVFAHRWRELVSVFWFYTLRKPWDCKVKQEKFFSFSVF